MKEKCKKHPTYKALQKPRADCKICREMFEEAELERNKESEILSCTFD